MKVSEQLFLDAYSIASRITLLGVAVDTPVNNSDFQDSVTCEIFSSKKCHENDVRINEFFNQIDSLNKGVDERISDICRAAGEFKSAVERLYEHVGRIEAPELDLIPEKSDDSAAELVCGSDTESDEFWDYSKDIGYEPSEEEEEFNRTIAENTPEFMF